MPQHSGHSISFAGLVVLITLLSHSAYSQTDCILKKDKEGIKVYTCASAQSKFRSIKATFTADARLSQLVAFLLDVEHYTDWQYNTIKSSMISKISDQEIIFYTVIAAPWPVADRDMIVSLVVSQDENTKVVTVVTTSVPKLVPEEDDVVRVPMSIARWTIEPLSASQVKVDYFIQIDPGGSVPAWMVNMVSTQAPYDSFRALKAKIVNHSSKDVKLPFIIDY